MSARKAGLTARDVPPRLGTLPFTSERRYMATAHAGGVVYLKGAVERIADLCGVEVDTRAEDLAADGLRVVLALATARLPVGAALTEGEPPRPGGTARPAGDARHAVGIEVRMITGDHPVTARHFAIDQDAVHARVSPEEKLRLVTEFQARGHRCRDGPRRHGGRQAGADVVLTDDDFASIGAAVEEGRSG